MTHIEPLTEDPQFGALVRGLRMSDLSDVGFVEQLRKTFSTNGVLVFRDTDVTTELHLALSRVFGQLEIHHMKEKNVPGHPELWELTADAEVEGIIEVNGEALCGYIPWHIDYWFIPRPNWGSCLRAIKVPERGGDTGFLDLARVYERLPQRLKSTIEGRDVTGFLRMGEAMFRYYPFLDVKIIDLGSAQRAVQAREEMVSTGTAFPFVIEEPYTRRRVLNFSPMLAKAVLGMEDEEAHALFLELASYFDSPDLVYRHKWSVGEMVIWNNRRLAHMAYGTPVGLERLCWRTTILSSDDLGRALTSDGNQKWSSEEAAA